MPPGVDRQWQGAAAGHGHAASLTPVRSQGLLMLPGKGVQPVQLEEARGGFEALSVNTAISRDIAALVREAGGHFRRVPPQVGKRVAEGVLQTQLEPGTARTMNNGVQGPRVSGGGRCTPCSWHRQSANRGWPTASPQAHPRGPRATRCWPRWSSINQGPQCAPRVWARRSALEQRFRSFSGGYRTRRGRRTPAPAGSGRITQRRSPPVVTNSSRVPTPGSGVSSISLIVLSKLAARAGGRVGDGA